MSQETVGSPVQWVFETMRNSWRTLKSVYYANTVAWRVLKSGTLLFFGFFLWAGGNLLLSYQPTWLWLRYVAAYGLVLLFYGPFHHLVVIPVALRWRRSPEERKSTTGRHLPNTGLAVFLVAVVVLGTYPAGPLLFDFGSTLDGTGADVNPDLLCTKSTDEHAHVHCHLTSSEGVDHVEVQSGGEVIAVDREPPFEWTVSEESLTEVTGQKQFQVVLRDEDGSMIRRYTRTLSMVPEG